jgi:hypothetical protein
MIPKRYPIRYNGTVYWVSDKDGSVINGFGAVVEEFKVDLDNRLIVRLDGLDNNTDSTRSATQTTKRFTEEQDDKTSKAE